MGGYECCCGGCLIMKVEFLSTFMKSTLILIFIGFLLLGCRDNADNSILEASMEESDKNPLGWKKLECGLYINNDGEIGFPTRPNFIFKEDELRGEDKMCPNKFITYLSDSIELKNIIDTNTFIHFSSSFYLDKNNIYNYYSMCDGGYLFLFSDDTSGFEVLNDEFVRHNSTIHHFRRGKIDADISSFKISSELTSIAKDKKGYFQFGERVSDEQLKDEMGPDKFAEIEREFSR